MIPCRFIYQDESGSASDSLNKECIMHAIPNIGDTICFLDKKGIILTSTVKQVTHYIHTENNTHEIDIFYGKK